MNYRLLCLINILVHIYEGELLSSPQTEHSKPDMARNTLKSGLIKKHL